MYFFKSIDPNGNEQKQCSSDADNSEMTVVKRHELLFAKALSITKWQVSWLTLPAPSHIQLYKVVYRRKLLSFTVARQPVIFTRFPINSFRQ